VTIDVGTGDGRAVLAAAAHDPSTLAIGLDPSVAAMVEASRRAVRSVRKGGLANALFVAASADSLPSELRGIAVVVTVHFPWASLLRGCLGADPRVAAGIASLLRPAGELELLLAPSRRDRLDGLPTTPAEVVEAATATFEAIRVRRVAGREATVDEIRASGSTWAKRLLGAANERQSGGSRRAGDSRQAGAHRPAGSDRWAGSDWQAGSHCPAAADRRAVLVRFRSP
jgi:16S rRNA (adenine(1408)-N(1))-methyltransferase